MAFQLDDASQSALRPTIIISILFVIGTCHFIYIFVKTRLEYRKLPGPPHSFLLGHLPSLVRAVRRYPQDAHPNIAFNDLSNEFGLTDKGLFYLDAFPVRNDRQLVITSPEVAAQVTKTSKHPRVADLFEAVLGRHTMALSNGSNWKSMRSTFAPAFAPANIFSLMPAILEESQLFVSGLSDAANTDGGFIESMVHKCQTLSFDLVCRLVLGMSMRSQVQQCELADLLHAAAAWPNPASLNPLEKYNLLRIVALKYYERRIKRLVDRMVLDRWASLRESLVTKKERAESHIIIDMALKSWAQSGQLDPLEQTNLPKAILDVLSDNVKGFVFGGEDTLANALSWTFFELSRHPTILDLVRQEHDEVFGDDPSQVSDLLRVQPRLVNRLRFTSAVIKEALRLYPPAATLRIGDDEMMLTANDGIQYPTKGHMIYLSPYIMQRSEKHFPAADSFLPQRWLEPDGAAAAGKAFRPFEHGPRSCAGQELAMVEMQVILALVARKFDFTPGYAELAEREGRGPKDPLPTVKGHGDHAYPIITTTPTPSRGLPMIVTGRG